MVGTARVLGLVMVVAASGCLIGWNEKAPPKPKRSYGAGQLDEEGEAPGAGGRTTFTVRVWADQDVRKLPRWRQRAQRTLDRANVFLGRAFGIELDARIQAWERAGASGDGPGAILEQLRAHDDGAGADWVLGLTGVQSRFSVDQHDIGFAETPGKYFVLRHVDDRAEAEYLRAELADRPAEQREGIIEDRRRHKELAIFLHEWAHTLGAVHDFTRAQVMRPEYDHEATGFTPVNKLIIRQGLRLRRKQITLAERRAVVEGLVSDLETGHWRGAHDPDRRALMKALLDEQQRLETAAEAPPPPPPPPSAAEPSPTQRQADADQLAIARRQRGLPPAGHRLHIGAAREATYVALFEKAYAALEAGNSAHAAAQARAGLGKFPGSPGLQAVLCGAEMVQRHLASARRACTAALAAWDETVFAYMFLAQMDESRDAAAAIGHLERLIALDPTQASAWQRLGELYRQGGRSRDFEQLNSRYLQRFGRSLSAR